MKNSLIGDEGRVTAMEPVFFQRPEGDPVVLRETPRLSRWNRSGDPDQVRLALATDHAERSIRSRWDALPGPAALRLDVGLHRSTRLLHRDDLDNYLLPLADRLGRDRIVAAWASKRYTDRTLLRAEPARPGDRPDGAVDLTADATSEAAYQQEIRAQLADRDVLGDGPLELELAFLVGPTRDWVSLWKPTVDALGPLLGETNRQWHPKDGRIVDLALHGSVDEDAGDRVTVAIRIAGCQDDDAR